jgi:hypothetical protein
VTYFDNDAPLDFSEFDRAFIALFRVAAGDAWVDSLPSHDPDGHMNFGYVRIFTSSLSVFPSPVPSRPLAVVIRRNARKATVSIRLHVKVNACLSPLNLFALAAGAVPHNLHLSRLLDAAAH